MSWAAVIGGVASIAGSAMSAKKDKQANQQTKVDIDKLREDDYAKNNAIYAKQLRDARFNRQDPYSSTSWTTDPVTGQMTQSTQLNAAQQGLLDSTNQNKQRRMDAASKIDFGNGGNIDWNSLGFGNMAKAVGLQPGGTTGKSPWADQPYSSAGGDYLNYMSRQPEGMSAFTPTPYQPGVLTQPRGGGVFTGAPTGGGVGLAPNQQVVDVAKLLQGG